jgi:PAS domain S-box-containing protein
MVAAVAHEPHADVHVGSALRSLVASLRFKVTAGVILILAVALGVVFAFQYRWIQREMIERLGLSSAPLSDVIKGSLVHAMQTRNPSELQAIVDNVSRQPGVRKVVVVDKRGEIRVSPAREEIGRRLGLDDPTCQLCHALRAERRARTAIFTAGGERVFRNVTPIANEPACFGCHDRRQRLNGVLITDFSMAEIDSQLAARLRQMLLAVGLAVGAAGLTITLIMNRLVIGKLERFVQATRLLGKGRLDLAVEVRSADEIGALASSFNEMVARLRRANEVRERKELLENVLDHVDDSVAVFAPDGTLLALNRAGERALGVAAADVVGRGTVLLGPGQADLLARAAAGPLTTPLELPAAGGRRFPARVHAVPLRNEAGTLLASVVIAHDLTAERQEAELGRQLAQAEKLAAVGRLAAGVAHELNNPLGNVLLYSKLLLEDASDPVLRDANVRRIADNALRCKAIVRGLLDYARQSPVEMDWADLNLLVEGAVGLVAGEVGLRRVALELRLAEDLPKVRCDGRQVQQVLVNLIQNGLEATEAGGRVTVFTERADGDGVVVGVRDQGRGVAPRALERLFEPFNTTKERGMGLGLSICYGIVERHRGRIWVESRPDGAERGSTFYVRLPLDGDGGDGR